MKVCVQGLWHLGSVTAACLASVGHDVVGLDTDQKTVDGLNQGRAPLFEPCLDDLLQRGIAKGRLCFTTAIADAAANADVLWVTFDTPVDDDDRADVEFVLNQVKAVLPVLADGAVVLVSSQMPVGSIRKLEAFARENLANKQLSFACSPENLRLGKALDVFLKPDRIVVGVRTDDTRHKLEQLLFPVTDKIEWMSVESAEMTKHAINAFLATSVVFANEIASLCEVIGADAKEVERGLKSESRIGPKAYLSPGGPFAGGTLARDVEFLKGMSAEERLPVPVLSAIQVSNDQHKNWVRRRLQAYFPILKNVTFAIWGLTYKPGTDALRRSQAVELCDWLLSKGAVLKVHDPAARDLPPAWGGRVHRVAEPLDALAGAAALVVATEWPVYKEISQHDFSSFLSGLVIIDANRFLSRLAGIADVRYVAVGTPG